MQKFLDNTLFKDIVIFMNRKPHCAILKEATGVLHKTPVEGKEVEFVLVKGLQSCIDEEYLINTADILDSRIVSDTLYLYCRDVIQVKKQK